MQTFSYFSRNLLLEQIQRVIFTKRVKPLNWKYYLYFTLPRQNRLLVVINSYNLYSECFIKYEDRRLKDVQIFKWHIKNSTHIENLTNIVDEKIENLNLKNDIVVETSDNYFWDCKDDFDLLT